MNWGQNKRKLYCWLKLQVNANGAEGYWEVGWGGGGGEGGEGGAL